MPQAPRTVSRPVRLRMLAAAGTTLPVEAQLRYAADDPYAVEALFDTGEPHLVRWVFARELLAAGLTHPCGEGDVAVAPGVDEAGSASVRVRLSSPDGQALLEAPAGAVSGFLASTYAVVPAGQETAHLRLDDVVTSLLAP